MPLVKLTVEWTYDAAHDTWIGRGKGPRGGERRYFIGHLHGEYVLSVRVEENQYSLRGTYPTVRDAQAGAEPGRTPRHGPATRGRGREAG